MNKKRIIIIFCFSIFILLIIGGILFIIKDKNMHNEKNKKIVENLEKEYNNKEKKDYTTSINNIKNKTKKDKNADIDMSNIETKSEQDAKDEEIFISNSAQDKILAYKSKDRLSKLYITGLASPKELAQQGKKVSNIIENNIEQFQNKFSYDVNIEFIDDVNYLSIDNYGKPLYEQSFTMKDTISGQKLDMVYLTTGEILFRPIEEY